MIIVTGANRGLGQAIAERLTKQGEEVLRLVRTVDDNIPNAIACDVSDYQSVKNAARQIKKHAKPVTAIINAAGVASMNMAVMTDSATVARLIQTNLVGTISCCQLFAPLLLRQKQGCIINFSSIAVPLALKGESVYAASKAGVETFSRAFAREMADFNVRVNCIAPGPIATDMLKGVSSAQVDALCAHQIFTKQFTPQEVCDLVELLLDKRASGLTGQVFALGGI